MFKDFFDSLSVSSVSSKKYKLLLTLLKTQMFIYRQLSLNLMDIHLIF